MVTRCHNNDVTWQRVDLEQEGAHDTFDFSRLVAVASLFAHRVELVEEQYTSSGSGIFEDLANTVRCFSEITSDDPFITSQYKRSVQGISYCLCQGCLAISRRSCQQHTIAWLKVMCPEQICSMLFLYKIAYDFGDLYWQYQVVKPPLWNNLGYK